MELGQYLIQKKKRKIKELKHCVCLSVMSEHGHTWSERTELVLWITMSEGSMPEGLENKNIWNV